MASVVPDEGTESAIALFVEYKSQGYHQLSM